MKLIIGATAALIASLLASSVHAQQVFFDGTGNYYELVTTNATWEEAESFAAERMLFGIEGHLATLTSQEENTFLLDTFGGLSGWIGLSQAAGSIEPDQGFEWVTGEEFDFSAFGGAEPNNAGGNEDFVEFFNGNWNDLNATSARRYYVEFETNGVPEPTSLPAIALGVLLLASCRQKQTTRLRPLGQRGRYHAWHLKAHGNQL